MATGQYTSDLDVGDVLGPVNYTLSSFVVREYAHSNELHQPYFQGKAADLAMPPTLIHLDKLRLYRHACPKGAGPNARIHYEYDCTVHEPVRAGQAVSVSGKVAERFARRGRTHVVIDMELRDAGDGRLLIAYRDTVLLSFTPKS